MHLTTIRCLTACALLLLAACNTIEGAGQDIENTGDAIGDSAREAEPHR